MRKLKLQVQISIDGFIAGVNHEMDWITWNLDDALLKHISDINKDIDCILMGRVLAEGFIPHWKTEATDPTKKREFVKRMSEPYDFAMKMHETSKIVFSKSLQPHDTAVKGWENTVIANGDIVEEVTKLKNQSGQDIIAYGGSTFVSNLIRNKLIDEYNLFVNPAASDEEILTALQRASCQNLLSRAQNGINTMIGEGGVKVSGGEKQRLSIARALLRKPNLLVLDEATSALDSITEQEITETIKAINDDKNIITILIAHRLSTIMHANKIFVLEHGHLAEAGTHEQLLEEKGLYYAMWRQQIGERKISSFKPASEKIPVA